MRRAVAAGVLLSAALALGLESGTTAASSVPTSSAGYRSVTVTNSTGVSARVTQVRYTTSGGQITQVRPTFTGGLLTLRTIQARYGSDAAVTCGSLVSSLLNFLLGIYTTTVTCNVPAESATRPRPLTLTIS